MVAFCNLESSRLFKGVGLEERSYNIFSLYCDHWFKIPKWHFQVDSEHSKTDDVKKLLISENLEQNLKHSMCIFSRNTKQLLCTLRLVSHIC